MICRLTANMARGNPLDYQLTIVATGLSYEVEEEVLTEHQSSILPNSISSRRQQSPGRAAVTLLDEPEVSLHPELLSLLADLMREASTRTQLIVATHADRLVRFLEPKEVVTFDVNEDGTVDARWADQLDFEEWLKEYALDEVWRLGRMGGRA